MESRHLDAKGKGQYVYDFANDIMTFKVKDRDYKHSTPTRINHEEMGEITREVAYSKYLDQKWPGRAIDREGPDR